jgi:molecular chaperone DnaK
VNQNQTIITVDFGTSNTYVSKTNASSLLVNAIDIEGKSSVQGTLSLLIELPNQVKVIGYTAAEELGEMDEEEFNATKIYAQFKPDIVESNQAQKATVEFLSQLLKQLNDRSLQINPLNSRVIFGTPSNASFEFKQNLKILSKQAGWGEIEIIDEPIAALCYHMAHREIELQNILSSGLIIDFGGGTCDLVWLNQGNIQESWGDRFLGGRLFDDLIFQWIKDQNPEMQQLSRSDLHFIRYLKSRTIKENFSNSLTLHPQSVQRSTVFSRNAIKINIENLNKSEFEQRARQYTLSAEMYTQMKMEGLTLCDELLAPCDLFDWFRRLLRSKLNHQKIDFVILAGGSSLWYFIKEMLIQDFGVNPDQIFRSARPFAAISEGLAHYPFLINRFTENQKKLKEDLPNFIKNQISDQLQLYINDYQNIFNQLMINLVFDQGVKPVLEQFKTNGGKLNQLEKEIKDVLNFKIEMLRQQLPTFTKHLNEKYQISIQRELKNWFKS